VSHLLEVLSIKVWTQIKVFENYINNVFSGRGSMRYLDPENTRQHNLPRNYDSRPQDTRSRRPPPLQQRIADSERWQKGTAGGRPSFEGLDRDMDKYRRARTGGSETVGIRGRSRSRSGERKRSRSPRRSEGTQEDVVHKVDARERDRSRSYDRRSASPIRDISPPLAAAGITIKGRARSESGSDMSMDKDD